MIAAALFCICLPVFEADLEGDTATQVRDVIYNYDTTNAPTYTEDAAHGHLYNVNEY